MPKKFYEIDSWFLVCILPIDIEGAKIDCSSLFIVPATSAAQNRLFLLWPFTVLMKKTRAVKQSIIFRCLWYYHYHKCFLHHHNIHILLVFFKLMLEIAANLKVVKKCKQWHRVVIKQNERSENFAIPMKLNKTE